MRLNPEKVFLFDCSKHHFIKNLAEHQHRHTILQVERTHQRKKYIFVLLLFLQRKEIWALNLTGICPWNRVGPSFNSAPVSLANCLWQSQFIETYNSMTRPNTLIHCSYTYKEKQWSEYNVVKMRGQWTYLRFRSRIFWKGGIDIVTWPWDLKGQTHMYSFFVAKGGDGSQICRHSQNLRTLRHHQNLSPKFLPRSVAEKLSMRIAVYLVCNGLKQWPD